MDEFSAEKLLQSIDKGIKKLIDNAVKRDTTLFSITGVFDSSGVFEQKLHSTFYTKSSSKYFVYMKRFQCIQSIYNVIKDVNDKFRYFISDNPIQVFTIPPGVYSVSAYSDMVRQLVSTTDILFELDVASGRTLYKLLNGIKVVWNISDTFAKYLGFNSGTITGSGISPNNVDLVDHKTIYIGTDIIAGSGYYFQGGPSHIIHSFANNYANGVMIDEQLPFKVPFYLTKSQFSGITVQAFDQDKKPIDFSGEQFVLELMIQES